MSELPFGVSRTMVCSKGQKHTTCEECYHFGIHPENNNGDQPCDSTKNREYPSYCEPCVWDGTYIARYFFNIKGEGFDGSVIYNHVFKTCPTQEEYDMIHNTWKEKIRQKLIDKINCLEPDCGNVLA